ncbi:MAG TPA: hypothetical protein VLJ80_13475 [Solirubrobacteraceae bacterium]|nr:hypothetical protein [Solirubrobacteraceae bacterium]
MIKWALALASSIVVLAGCGGSAHSDSTARVAHSPAEVAAACDKTSAARQVYTDALARLGLKVSDTPLVRNALGATEGFRLGAAELQRVTDGADRQAATLLVVSLSEQEKELRAFIANNLPEAQKYGNKLNIPLQEALQKLGRIC